MKVEIKIPSMGESVVEAIVSTILKADGSLVSEDEEILELETDKVNQVLHAPKSGQLQLSVKVGDHVTIGQVIGAVDTAAAPSPKEKTAPPKKEAEIKSPEKGAPEKTSPSEMGARKKAPEFVQELKEPPKHVAPPEKRETKTLSETPKMTRKKMSNLRKVIAERLVAAKNTTAMLTSFNEADMTAIMEIRKKEQENFTKRYGVKLGFMSFFVKGVVAALKAYPAVNGMIEGDEILLFSSYDIGIAVSTERGLMVPVVRNCDELSFGQIEQAIDGFAKKARSGTISIDDLKGGSFTITNGGVFGSLLSTPILNPPQSGILGMHTIVRRPVAMGDQVVIRPIMYLALSYDHRIIDGKEAVQFLVHLKASLEDPSRLLLDL